MENRLLILSGKKINNAAVRDSGGEKDERSTNVIVDALQVRETETLTLFKNR